MASRLPLFGCALALTSLVLACAAEPADTGAPLAGSGGGGNAPFGGSDGNGGSDGGGTGFGGRSGSAGESGASGATGGSGTDGVGGALGSNGSSGAGSSGATGSSGAFGSDGSGGTGGSGGTAVDGGVDGCIPFPFPCPTGGTAGAGGAAGTPGDAGDFIPGFTPVPNNPPQCPPGAPANPIGPCLGLPVYLACNYTNGMRNYGCICDWYHWLCI